MAHISINWLCRYRLKPGFILFETHCRDKILCICHSQRLEIDIFVAKVLKLTFAQGDNLASRGLKWKC